MGVKSRLFEHPEVIGVIAHSVVFHGVVCAYRVFRSLLECVEHKRHFLSLPPLFHRSTVSRLFRDAANSRPSLLLDIAHGNFLHHG